MNSAGANRPRVMPPAANLRYWRLDYSWSRRGGRWSDDTDVMLVGDTQGDAACQQALAAWVARQGHDDALVDGETRRIFYAGGVQGYVQDGAIYLHSHGQDAFDSLSYYSEQIARYLRLQGCRRGLLWTEARHDRADHQLRW